MVCFKQKFDQRNLDIVHYKTEPMAIDVKKAKMPAFANFKTEHSKSDCNNNEWSTSHGTMQS